MCMYVQNCWYGTPSVILSFHTNSNYFFLNELFDIHLFKPIHFLYLIVYIHHKTKKLG